MGVFVGVIVAACFGSGDFFGGLASRRAPTLAVLGVAQIVAITGAIVAALVFTGSPSGRDLGLGAAAGARVFVDGMPVGSTPLVLPDVTAGSHTVRIEMPGYRPWITTITLSRGMRSRVGASLEP